MKETVIQTVFVIAFLAAALLLSSAVADFVSAQAAIVESQMIENAREGIWSF